MMFDTTGNKFQAKREIFIFFILLLCCSLTVWAGEEPDEESPAAQQSDAVAVTASKGGEAEIAKGDKDKGEKLSSGQLHRFKPYIANFDVSYNGVKVGEMKQQLTELRAGRQTLQTKAHTTGLVSWFKDDVVTERSIWQEEDGLRKPLSYTYRYTGSSKEVFERIEFDWEKGEASSLRDDKTTLLEVERGTLDKHMIQIVLRDSLFQGGKHYSYPVADRSKLKQYEFELVGSGVVESEKLGRLECLKVRRDDTLFWVAHKYDYLPVLIEQFDGDTTISSEITSYRSLAGG